MTPERLCTRPEYDPEWWSVGYGVQTSDNLRAVKICNECPFKESCAVEASQLPVFLRSWTIWAGHRWDIKVFVCRGCQQPPDGVRLRADGFCGKACREETLCGTSDGFESHLRWRTIPCDDCCSAAGRERPAFPQKSCAFCGVRFEVTGRGKQEYCSKTCWTRMQAHIRKMNQQMMATPPEKKSPELEYKAGMEYQCRNLGCEQTFVLSSAKPSRRYCCQRCAKQRRDAWISTSSEKARKAIATRSALV